MDLLTPSPTAVAPGALLVWVALVGAFTLLWAVSLPLKNASIVDMWWGPAFVLAALVYAAPRDVLSRRGVAVIAVVALWALRLAWHIGRRNVGHGEDPRYSAWRTTQIRWVVISVLATFLLVAILYVLGEIP